MKELYTFAKQDAERTWLRLAQSSDPGIDRRTLQPYSGGWNWHVWEEALGAEMSCVNADYWLHQGRGPQYCVPVRITVDGDQWCATFTDFVNLQESPAGFGETVAEAVEDLGRSRVKDSVSD